VRALIDGGVVKNTDALANPEVLANFRSHRELEKASHSIERRPVPTPLPRAVTQHPGRNV